MIMDSNEETYDKISFIILIIPTFIFTVVFIVYFAYISIYIKSNYSLKSLTKYWLDYFITITLGIIYIIISFLNLFIVDRQTVKNIADFSSEIFPIILISVLFFFFYTLITNILYDFIEMIYITVKIIKINKIKTAVDFTELSLLLKNINLFSTFNLNHKGKFFIITNIINAIFVTLYIILYFNDDLAEDKGIFSLKYYKIIFLKIYHLVVFILFILGLIVMNYFKKKLLSKNFYMEDKLGMNVYNLIYNQILYFTDILLHKSKTDLLLNCSLFLYLALNQLNIFSSIFFEVNFYLYVIMAANIFFSIDKNNCGAKKSENLKYIFFTKSVNLQLCENSYNLFKKDYDYYYLCSHKEKKILKLLNVSFFEDDDESASINLENESSRNNTNSLIINSSYSYRNESLPSINNIIQNTKPLNKLNFDCASEFYILYKLLMLYFNKNKKIYDNILKQMNEDGLPFKRFFGESNNPLFSTINSKSKLKQRQSLGISASGFNKIEYLSNVDRVSRISKLNSTKVTTSLKFDGKNIFVSLEEKELLEEFKHKYQIPENKFFFQIESIAASPFFEIFPFYQIKVDDIIYSLNPSDNKKLFNVFISNLKKGKDSEKETNLFYTYNSLLMIEVYEPNEFIEFNEIPKFTSLYKNYILKTVKNLNYTFLPLIVGIFNVNICGQKKIILIYRDPLYFSNFNNFNHWINFYITEGPEKLKVSLMLKDIIDVNEIEIKNNLKFNEADYEEVKSNLKSDFNFLNDLNFQIFPIIHLFIGDENDVNEKANLDFNDSTLNDGDDSQKQQSFTALLNVTGLSNKDEKVFEAEYSSLLEKEYYSMTGLNCVHTIKIYLTNFFRLNCDLNKNKETSCILKSSYYCQFLEGQLLSYLTKTTLFDGDENDAENTNNII